MRKILVADDHMDQRNKVRDVLRDIYEVILAEDGITASDKFQELGVNGIDGMVLDYMMTHEDDPRLMERRISLSEFQGDALAREFRRVGFNGPIVIRSSVAGQLIGKVKDLDVYLHDKYAGDEKIIGYFQSKLHEC